MSDTQARSGAPGENWRFNRSGGLGAERAGMVVRLRRRGWKPAIWWAFINRATRLAFTR